MKRRTPYGLLGLLSLTLTAFFPPTRCQAEWLYFKNGGRVQAPVVRQEGRIFIETPSSRFAFPEEDFRAIVPGGCPDQEWPSRRQAVSGAGADRQFAAAWWALENGLIPEAVAMLRTAHATDPRHEPTLRLVKLLDRLDRPCFDPDYDPLCRALGTPLEVERGPHVLLLHQCDQAEARARVDLLERVTTAYYLTVSAQGLDLTVPCRRLISVSLRDRHDYRSFLDSQGATAFRTTLGYFHPYFRAVLTIDPRTTDKFSSGGSRLSTSTSEAARTLETLPGDPERPDLLRLRLLADFDAAARADGTAAHELIHLLVAESGLAREPGEFPLWFHEGFAAQFEVVRGGRWAGVSRAHDLRLRDWRSAKSAGLLEPLIRDTGFGHGYRRELYANSWALVFFLRKTRSRELSTYLDLLRTPNPESDRTNPSRFESEFRTAFGEDLRNLEQEWRNFMKATSTPLEEHDPDMTHIPPLSLRIAIDRPISFVKMHKQFDECGA